MGKKLIILKKQTEPYKRTVEEVSFEWYTLGFRPQTQKLDYY